MEQLNEQVARIVGRAMDRTRPFWEVYVIQGLASGDWALLTKMHHSAVDGAAGQLILNALHDTDPHAPPPAASPPWEPEAVPTDAELVQRATQNMWLNPYKAAKAGARITRELAERVGLPSFGSYPGLPGVGTPAAPAQGKPAAGLVGPAPSTPFNKTITRNRRFAVAEASLPDAKRLKDATGATVNDIVLAICAGALRAYLLAHDALPAQPLRVMVPVSIRTANEADPWTNRVSAIFAELPTDCDDPLERVARCRAAMIAAKRQHEMIPAAALADLTQYSSPVLAAAASRLTSEHRLADRVRPTTNLVISNVPGPRQPIYLAGAQLLHQFPVSIVTDGQGLNITVHSYLESLDFGFIVDRELVPDVQMLADLHLAEIEVLFQATGAERHPRPAPRTSGQQPDPVSGRQPRRRPVRSSNTPGTPAPSAAVAAAPATGRGAPPKKAKGASEQPPSAKAEQPKTSGGRPRAQDKAGATPQAVASSETVVGAPAARKRSASSPGASTHEPAPSAPVRRGRGKRT